MIKISLDPIMGINLEARVRALTYNLEGESVTVYTRVVPVDENGNEIDNPIVKPFDREIKADNRTIVRISDGSYVDTTADGYEFDEHTMQGEFDYFQNIADNQSIVVNDLILQKLQQAKENNRFEV